MLASYLILYALLIPIIRNLFSNIILFLFSAEDLDFVFLRIDLLFSDTVWIFS